MKLQTFLQRARIAKDQYPRLLLSIVVIATFTFIQATCRPTVTNGHVQPLMLIYALGATDTLKSTRMFSDAKCVCAPYTPTASPVTARALTDG